MEKHDGSDLKSVNLDSSVTSAMNPGDSVSATALMIDSLVEWDPCIRLDSSEQDINLLSPGFGSCYSISPCSPLRNFIPHHSSASNIDGGQISNLRLFKPFLDSIAHEDIDYLRKKDALSIPDPTLRAELLRSYTSSVHPQFPIVDLDKFMDALSRNKFTGWGIGLLLFQAIMFAGAAFVDFQVLQSPGFETRQQIQDLLFSRVKV